LNEKENMQIHLTQNEITAAVKMFIAQQGISMIGRDVSVDFTAGRKENGLTAEVMIGEVEAVFAEAFDPNQLFLDPVEGATLVVVPDAPEAAPVERARLFGTN
jgi:hypothetical protein